MPPVQGNYPDKNYKIKIEYLDKVVDEYESPIEPQWNKKFVKVSSWIEKPFKYVIYWIPIKNIKAITEEVTLDNGK